ncbi:cupin domain-containing protein [Sulfurospirillum diekertiae]|uniref:Cupin type-2 domain-containing protein n=1 Tax=Sulfurospirillum diekertiae TaxID=1854492 RepID=A0A1Y0HIQ0_9BACT|nr:cupin domain-containing protein [Sulfurospirillum diekertiae]ARU47971.1 hypothetical protein Sdiek1_0804 [Sulfurospirillum diekertiae]ASC92818.1 hypothetical protein Sdiek2_0796 [Sulfurospirillum diekertiae]
MALVEQAFITPKNHVDFKAHPIINNQKDELLDCAIAFISPNGGGPNPDHIHVHDHFFTVIKGEIEIHSDNNRILLKEGMSYRVNGQSMHSVWNKGDIEAQVLGISLLQKNCI